ncbi:mannosylglucosyl-3-phosphoglycerate phosphatase-like isoform X2 [Tachypleus tridentatus]|uniref:mannosylglucosyl-3-phosphoglycerate phosphatase-like isoform X2 n=2 Tax=Tachypleus tridentatus TaxID=6853 RepID=UPI003FD65CE7
MPAEEAVVTILHFNDCYNVEPQPQEPVGGAARFCTALKSFSDLEPMILFSGDIFAPSIMSTFTKGEQMVPALNAFGVHCAVFGNHDFDFGVDNLSSFVKQTTFPWLISNVIDNDTNQPLADGQIVFIMERAGKKFGIIGLVEEEWLETLATIDPDDVTYVDFVSEGRKLARQLRDKEEVDYVIALTHMRWPNDCRLAENVDEIDLILGGHDHDYDIRKVNGKYVIKSGTDFREFSKITLTFNHLDIELNIDKIDVTSKYEEDPDLKRGLEKYNDIVEGKMDTLLGHFIVDLDGRFSSIRTKETNLGNFVCDIMLSSTHSDLAILNSGTLRSDRIHPAGDFIMRDLVTVLPMLDPLLVLSATGEQIWKALENGVSQYPKLEGRFPQVAGVSFAFDPAKPPGSRIDPRYVKIGDEFMELDQRYKLVTKSYLAAGKDGYDILKECEILLTEEESPELRTAVQNHFESIQVLTGAVHHRTRHRQSLVCVSRRHSVVKMYEDNNLQIHRVPLQRGHSLDAAGKRNQFVTMKQTSLDDIEHEQCKLEPREEGRISILTEEVRERLDREREEQLCRIMDEVIEEESSSGSFDKN